MKRRAAIFNDTSTSRHYGCAAVMDGLSRLLTRQGAEITYRHPVGVSWQDDETALAAIDGADIVIVNGEGTIHHSSPRARSLAELGPHCASRRKACYLVNSTLQANDETVFGALRQFDHIWVREKASSRQLSEQRIDSAVCADLTFLQQLSRGPRSGDTIVIDTVVPALLPVLGRMAADARCPMISMKADEYGYCLGMAANHVDPAQLKSPLSTPWAPVASFQDYASIVGSYDRMISGRFHAVCFAIVMRMPFHAVASNTFKIQAMVADIGLAADRMIDPRRDLPDHRPYDKAELDAIDDFIAMTKVSAEEMAARIIR